jgi:hypothetical protein
VSEYTSLDPETQGVALGWNTTALSAPESKSSKYKFTSLDTLPFMRWLLFTLLEFWGNSFIFIQIVIAQ